MIVWSSWQTNYIVNGQKNIFGMNREPASIFDNHYLTGFISTVHGDCRVNSTEKYDFTRGMMTLNCVDLIQCSPHRLGPLLTRPVLEAARPTPP